MVANKNNILNFIPFVFFFISLILFPLHFLSNFYSTYNNIMVCFNFVF